MITVGEPREVATWEERVRASGHWKVAVEGGLGASELPEREGNIDERAGKFT